jgi:hypothetical protein
MFANKQNAAVQRMLPNLLLNHTSGTDESSCHAWIRLAAENPAALQVRLYTAELHYRALFQQLLNPTTNLLAIYAAAIKLLNEQLKDPATVCSDGNVIAVGGLGFFGRGSGFFEQSLPKLQSASALPTQGPLLDLQRRHVYSQMVYDPMHCCQVHGHVLLPESLAYKVVLGNIRRCRILWSFGLVNRGVTQPSPLQLSRNGFVDQDAGRFGQVHDIWHGCRFFIVSVLLAGSLSTFQTLTVPSGDIINATENLCPPRYFFAAMIDTPIVLEIQKPDSPTRIHPLLQHLGSDFPTNRRESNIPSLQDLSTVLQNMAMYTTIVYNHVRGVALQENIGKVADMRNFVQHSLLSIPPSDRLPATPDPLYEATRLASFIYSLLIVFPIHGPRAPFAELASQLRFNLSFLDLNKQKETELILWILVMGAIAGMNMANRIWFVWAIREATSRLRVERWEELRESWRGFCGLGLRMIEMDGWCGKRSRVQMRK